MNPTITSLRDEQALETFKELCPNTWKYSNEETIPIDKSTTQQAFVRGADWGYAQAKDKIERLKHPTECKVHLCEGGIWECMRSDLEAQLAQANAKLERAKEMLRNLTYKNYDKTCLQSDVLACIEEIEK